MKASKKLNVGSGLDKREGYVNLDYNETCNPDVKHHLEDLPLPFKKNSFNEILCNHVIEHLKDPLKVIDEFWRISVNGGLIKIRVPHCSHYSAYGDLTHFSYYNSFSFTNFEDCPEYYGKSRFKINKVYLHTYRSQQKRFLRFVSGIIDSALNFDLHLTEAFLCKFLPVSEIQFELEVVK